MGAKIDDELSKRLREAESTEPQRDIPVIVMLRPGADAAELERRGLKVLGRYENISAVYGSIAASAVSGVETLDSVTRIEYDPRASALGSSRA